MGCYAFSDRQLVACALRQDIALLKDGDQTEVGEKGITLSVRLLTIKLRRSGFANPLISRVVNGLVWHSLGRSMLVQICISWMMFWLLLTLTSHDTFSVSKSSRKFEYD